MFRTAVTAAAILVLGACSSAHPGRTVPVTASSVITHPEIAREIARGGSQPAYALIRTLRPTWECWGAVFVDGSYIGAASEQTLETPSANINSIQCLPTGPAYARFGPKAIGGAILIKTF